MLADQRVGKLPQACWVSAGRKHGCILTLILRGVPYQVWVWRRIGQSDFPLKNWAANFDFELE
jgi:hypothetical protein